MLMAADMQAATQQKPIMIRTSQVSLGLSCSSADDDDNDDDLVVALTGGPLDELGTAGADREAPTTVLMS